MPWNWVIIFVLCLGIIQPLEAQLKYDYNWVFGYRAKAYSNEPQETGGNQLSFNDGKVILSPTPDKISALMRTSATISDRWGNLLFWSNGCWIENKHHEIMENGDSISVGRLTDGQCAALLAGQTQNMGAFILPSSKDSNQYFLVNQVNEIINPPDTIFYFTIIRLQYALIDMSYNNGAGKVLEKRVPIIEEDEMFYGNLFPVKHANGKDWWILQKRHLSDEYYTILFQNDTFKIMGIQSAGLVEEYNSIGSGTACFNSDGTKYAVFSTGPEQLQLFDFDNETGLLSNYQNIHVEDQMYLTFGGIMFSPSGRFLYAANYDTLWQFDMEAPDIQASQSIVGIWDNYWVGSLPAAFHQMQTGPDCRIYMSCVASVPYVHVIHHPDRKGTECGFEQRAISLPYYNGRTLPNTPYYRAGTEYPICDTTIQWLSTSIQPDYPYLEEVRLTLWPNPVSDVLSVELGGHQPTHPHSVHLHDLLGREVIRMPYETPMLIPVQDLPPGLYLVEVHEASGRRWAEKVVVR